MSARRTTRLATSFTTGNTTFRQLSLFENETSPILRLPNFARTNSYSRFFPAIIGGLLSLASAPIWFNQTTYAESMPMTEIHELQNLPEPVLEVKELMRRCVYEVNDGIPFKWYIQRVTVLVRENEQLFRQAYPDIEPDQLLTALASIEDKKDHFWDITTIIKRLWDYWPLLPNEFWNLGYKERYDLFKKRMSHRPNKNMNYC